MYSSLVVLLVTVAVAANADKLKCSMVPLNTEDGLMGYCCVFFKNTSTVEAQTKQIINMFAKRKKDNDKVNVEYKPPTPRSDTISTTSESARHLHRYPTVDEIPKHIHNIPRHTDTFFPGDMFSGQKYKTDSFSDKINVVKDDNRSVIDHLKSAVTETSNVNQPEAESVLEGSNVQDKLEPHPEDKANTTYSYNRNSKATSDESDSSRTLKQSDKVNTRKIIEFVPDKGKPATSINISEYKVVLPVREYTTEMEYLNSNNAKIENTTTNSLLEYTTKLVDSKMKEVDHIYFPEDAVTNGTDKNIYENVTGKYTKVNGEDSRPKTEEKDKSSDKKKEPKIVLEGRNKDDVPETCTEGQGMDVNGECIDKF